MQSADFKKNASPLSGVPNRLRLKVSFYTRIVVHNLFKLKMFNRKAISTAFNPKGLWHEPFPSGHPQTGMTNENCTNNSYFLLKLKARSGHMHFMPYPIKRTLVVCVLENLPAVVQELLHFIDSRKLAIVDIQHEL